MVRSEFTVWSARDVHSQAYATLTTARAARIGDTLQIKSPAADNRCTVCHAPLGDVPPDRREKAADALQGVSCESCHNAAEPWLRSHTRSDYTRNQRLAAGMRELHQPLSRANTCVACHQVVDPDLLRAGHPELVFELDGQTVSEPPHWDRKKDADGARFWWAGQIVALREMSAQLMRLTNAELRQVEAWQGLAWLMSIATENSPSLSWTASPDGYKQAFVFAQKVTGEGSFEAPQLLRKLAGHFGDFKDTSVAPPVHAHRAERLVLALDRLSVSTSDSNKIDSALAQLFKLVQDRHEFSPQEFSRALERCSEVLK